MQILMLAGGRTAKDIVNGAIDAAKQVANDRLSGRGGSSSGGSKSSGSSDAVIELTESNFEAQVINGNDLWLVEFFGKPRRACALWKSLYYTATNSSVVRPLQESRT